MKMTEAQIAKLPDAVRRQVMTLKASIGNAAPATGQPPPEKRQRTS
jgi:hypothetical protein